MAAMISTPMRQFFKTLLTIFAITMASGANAEDFVKASGTTFSLGQEPFFVAGVNNHYLPHASTAEITRVLDDAAALGAQVLRIYLEPVIGSPDGKVPTIWDWRSQANSNDLGAKGRYLVYWDTETNKMAINEGPDGIQKIDFIVAEAKKRNIRLIIAFLDFWDYTGGAQQIRAWYGSHDKNTFFFHDPRTKADYQAWVSYVISRLNPNTNVRYRDETTIMAWELMNEPNAQPPEVRREWMSEMSAFIKKLDPNHLVGTGHANGDFRQFDIAIDLSIETIDFGTWHGYPLYFKLSPAGMNDLIPRYCALARTYGKPVLFEEFGYARKHADQVEVYRNWIDTITRDPDCAGWAIWRLVSIQDDGKYPVDEVEQFDIHNDGGPLWTMLRDEIRKGVKAREKFAD